MGISIIITVKKAKMIEQKGKHTSPGFFQTTLDSKHRRNSGHMCSINFNFISYKIRLPQKKTQNRHEVGTYGLFE